MRGLAGQVRWTGTEWHHPGQEDKERSDRENQRRTAGRRDHRSRLPSRVAAFLEQAANSHTGNEAEQTDPGIQIAAAQALQHAERTAKKDEGSDSHPGAKENASSRMG